MTFYSDIANKATTILSKYGQPCTIKTSAGKTYKPYCINVGSEIRDVNGYGYDNTPVSMVVLKMIISKVLTDVVTGDKLTWNKKEYTILTSNPLTPTNENIIHELEIVLV